MGFSKLSLGLLAAAVGLVSAQNGTYVLVDSYDYTNWEAMMAVQNITDPTNGFVTYVADPASMGLMQTVGEQVFIGVDNTTVLDPAGPGRNSVRLQSNTAYNQGLFIADFAHVPGSNCGSWPAFWMVGPNWPNQGEIDILEGVNDQKSNQMTLHTGTGCTPVANAQAGTSVGNADCGADGGFTGCGVTVDDDSSYGDGFNAAGGGVYAMEWNEAGISVWYWTHDNVPDMSNPDPSSWGTAAASWGSGCDYTTYFKDMNIIFDNTFCGDWAGQVWSGSTCVDSTGAPDCPTYVAEHPEAYDEAYWLVNSVKTYSAA